jgi:hypothetical protein
VRSIFLIGILFTALTISANEIDWDSDSKKLTDIDCDGIPDEVIVGYSDTTFQLKVTPSSSNVPLKLEFALGNSFNQAALCGTTVFIKTYQTNSESIKEEFGEVFEGYQSAAGCFDINLSGGDCDSINVFWNHKTKGLNWWRR